jgi:hypothetical protein
VDIELIYTDEVAPTSLEDAYRLDDIRKPYLKTSVRRQTRTDLHLDACRSLTKSRKRREGRRGCHRRNRGQLSALQEVGRADWRSQHGDPPHANGRGF